MTPATCGSRYRGPHHTYACKRAPGHDGGHADQYPSGAVLATWTDTMAMPVADIADQASADLRTMHAAATGRRGGAPLSGVVEDVAAVRRERSEARERARKAERRAEHAEAERKAADDVIRATLAALGAGPDTDPVIKARETLASRDRWEALAAELAVEADATRAGIGELRKRFAESETNAHRLLQRAEAAEARAALADRVKRTAAKDAAYALQRAELAEGGREAADARLERSRNRWKRLAIQAQDDRDRYATEVGELRTRAEQAEAFRNAVYEELCITDSTPPDAAIGAIHGRAINIGEQAERAEKAIKRAVANFDRAEAAEARAAKVEAAADLRTQRVGQLERSRDYWKERAAELDADRDRYAAEAAELRTRAQEAEDEVKRVRRGGLYRQIRETAGYPLPTDATQEDRAVQEFARDLERWIPLVAGEEQAAAGATPDLTTPVSPREKTPARNDHPLWDLLDALTGPAISNDDAMARVRAYYDAITSAPPADQAEREEYATEQVQRAVRHLAGSTTNTDLWARIGMTLGWDPEHARDAARHRRLAGETDLSVKLTAAREQIKALIDARDRDRATLDTIRAALDTTEANG